VGKAKLRKNAHKFSIAAKINQKPLENSKTQLKKWEKKVPKSWSKVGGSCCGWRVERMWEVGSGRLKMSAYSTCVH